MGPRRSVAHFTVAPWTRLMVVPLTADSEEPLVRRIEGRVGAVLWPPDAVRLPTFGRSRRPAQRRATYAGHSTSRTPVHDVNAQVTAYTTRRVVGKTAGSLYCVRPGCRNPHHRDSPPGAGPPG